MMVCDNFDEAVDELFYRLCDRNDAIKIDIKIDTPRSRTIIYICDYNSGSHVGVWCNGRGAVYEERNSGGKACAALTKRLLQNGNIVNDRYDGDGLRNATHVVYYNSFPYYIIGDDHDAIIAALRLDGRWERV